MKPITRWCSLLLCLAVFDAATVAQEGPPKPGLQQEKLKEWEGKWKAAVKFGDQASSATAVFRMDFGGFCLVEEFEGEFGGAKFTGRGQTGYCPLRKRYIMTWVDSMTPSPMVLEGNFDAAGKSLTVVGEAPTMEGKMGKFKGVTRVVDADTHVYTMYQLGSDGSEQQIMSIEYKRQK
jgi:hypothetical protein